MENMDNEVKSSVDNPRKLLLGEHVEVRQKEVGLRGSWHPAIVVRVKDGRRVVEYDDLLTPDQSRKLQESIPLSNDIKLHSSTLRLKNGTKAKPEKRGFIRPRPPPCLTSLQKNWKRGLLVDAFCNGAWWEGILLDDVHFCHPDSKVKVFFPEEGDELRISMNDLRVSHEWDEDSGQWAFRGYWSLHNEMGKIDLSSLKDMCRTIRSSTKKLWRQKRFNGLQIQQIEEQRELQSICTSVSQKHLNVFEGDVDQGRTLAQEDTVLQKAKTNLLNSNEPFGRILQSSISPMSSEVQASLDLGVSSGIQSRNVDVIAAVNSGADERLSVDSGCILEISQRREADEGNGSQTCKDVDEQDFLKEQRVQKVKGKKNGFRKMKDTRAENSRASSRITRSTSTFTLDKQGFDKLPLSRLQETANGNSRDALKLNDMPQEEKLLPASSVEKLSGQHSQSSELNFGNEVSSNLEGTDCIRRNDALPSKQDSCLKFHENHSLCVQDNDLRCNGVVFTDCSIPHKVKIRQARLAAKQFLLDAGWKLDVRNRARGALTKQEVVYISPSGSRFFSLAAACRGWKSRDSHDESLGRGINKESDFLSVYYMSDDMRCLSSGQAKAEQMLVSAGLQEGEGKDSLPPAVCKVSGLSYSAMGMVDRKSVEPWVSNCDQRVKKKKLRQSAENQKKRKGEVLDGLSPAEVRRKRGRPSLKRGGCRMQVLLSFPGKSKDLDVSKTAGESSQFKKSTVLSWLMDKGILKENESVSYINRKDGHVMKKGQVTREGVICDCCKEVFTLSNFEAHAGSKLHRPSANTFLDDGRSISDCQLEACAFQDFKEKEGLMDISDDTCGVCGDGGELVLCDHCPSTFHADCIGLKIIPEGDWYCPRCCCGICGSNQLSAHDIDDAVHRCEQCELEYHLICAQEHTFLATPGAEMSTWFCDEKCKEIFTALRALVGISNPMENGFTWTLLRSMKKDQGLSPSSLEEMAEHHSKLSVAHGVMQECFVPMIDPRTNINLLSQAIYNRRSKVSRLNYAGFYTMLLERGDEIISVATIRVHGARLAEMPLVGTRYQYRRQGMCRRLMLALEEMLWSIGVEKLILPAVPELLDTWMGAFRFMTLSPEETRELSKLSLMTFPGTTLLQKLLPAGSQAKRSAYLSRVINKVDHISSTPCKSVEAFLSMARASLDCGLLDYGKAFIAGAPNGSGRGSSAKLDMLKKVPQSVDPVLLVEPQTPVTLEASKGSSHLFLNGGKLKNRLNHLETSGDGLSTSKVQKDDDIYTSVVITTTRSNRLVRSTRWVADGLKELKNAKQSKRTCTTLDTSSEPAVDLGCSKLFETLVQSNVGQDGKNVETVYVRTRRKTVMSVEGAEVNEGQSGQRRDRHCNSIVDSLQSDFQGYYDMQLGVLKSGTSLGQHKDSTGLINLDEVSCSGNYPIDGLCVDHPNLNTLVTDEFSICPKFYSRRKKRESMRTDFTRDFTEKATVPHSTEEQAFCAPVEGSLQGSRTSFIVSESPSGLLGGIAS